MNKQSGFYKNGKSHAEGGIPVLVDGNTPIEVEKFEYVICNNAMNSTKIFEFKDKTNKEILDEIFRYSDCEFEQHKANSGDFIICKLAVMDKKKRNITGTAKEIINVMQSEKSCNVTNDSKEFKDGGEVNNETYTKWKNLVNMSKSELEKFYESKEGKEAGLSSSEAKEQGISSGRESARWIMKMKDTPKSEWTPAMWKWANKQISFISRMSGMKGDLYDDNGNKTRKHTSLLIWGHNPKKYEDGGKLSINNEITIFDETKYDDNGKDCYWKTYRFNDSSISIDYCLGDFFKIDSIGTKEKSRRGGDASKLIDYAKEIALKNNFQKIDVYLPIDENTPRPEYTLEDYKKAVSFYKKNGFEFYKNSTVKMFCDLNKILKNGGELKTNEMENKYDYNNLIKINDVKIIDTYEGDNVKIISFIWNDNFYKWRYSFSKTSGSIHITKYPTLNDLENSNIFGRTHNEGVLIYNTYNSELTTDEGTYIEFSISKWDKKNIFSKSEETLKGGKADKLTIEDIAKKHNVSVEYAKEQLNKGMKIESEHTKDTEKQKEIALDHLSEFIEYYKELDKMEEKLKEENTFEREGFQTGKGLLYEFFTPQEVSDKMLALAQHYGFKGGKVLEPAAGNGRLLKHLKDSEITAFEINPKNYEDLKKQFPNAKIYNFNFEKAFLKEPRYNSLIDSKATKTWLKDYPFDLVLANPPYGKFSGMYSSYFKFKGQVEHFFILQTLYLLKSGGIGVYLVPSSFLRNGITYNNIKKTIFEIASLTDAYRLPSNIFKDTQIGTDIIVLTKK